MSQLLDSVLELQLQLAGRGSKRQLRGMELRNKQSNAADCSPVIAPEQQM
jgi:hypothetical protein